MDWCRWCSSKQRLDALAELLLHRLPLTLAAFLLLGAIAINFANVVGRYLFLASIYWADEAMVFLVIWSIFLAAVAVTYDGSQLTMDLFSTRLSPRWQRVLDAVIGAVCIVTFAFMAWQALTVVRTLMRNDQRSIALDIPIAIPHAALLVGFALSALVVIARMALGHRIIKPMSPDDVTSAM
jgi:TRAP-type C4-dicarboxylate transport system permease small subunit